MDGAIILSANADKILRAGVQLLPDGSLPTEETGNSASHSRPSRSTSRIPGAVSE